MKKDWNRMVLMLNSATTLHSKSSRSSKVEVSYWSTSFRMLRGTNSCWRTHLHGVRHAVVRVVVDLREKVFAQLDGGREENTHKGKKKMSLQNVVFGYFVWSRI